MASLLGLVSIDPAGVMLGEVIPEMVVPAPHQGPVRLEMELHAVGGAAVAEGLVGRDGTLRQANATRRQSASNGRRMPCSALCRRD